MSEVLHRFPARPADGLARRKQYLRFLHTQTAVNGSDLLRRQIQALEAEIAAAEEPALSQRTG